MLALGILRSRPKRVIESSSVYVGGKEIGGEDPYEKYEISALGKELVRYILE